VHAGDIFRRADYGKQQQKNRKISPKPLPEWIWPAFAILVSFIALFPTLRNEFVNWDDIVYVMNNEMIKDFSLQDFRQIFSSYYMGNYHPFTLLSFAADYSWSEMNPYGYHLHNLLLHLINVGLVYWLTWVLTQKKYYLSLLVALLFGIHPMHVESVAWISERKDLLYTFWYLLGLISYLYYIRKGHIRFYLLGLIAFLFSLLSKAQAVTLPMILLLIDYLYRREISRKLILEKIPFFILALLFGIIAIFAQQADNAINPVGITWVEALFFGQYSFIVYLIKFLVPVNLSCLHTYPLTPDGSAPWYIYLSPLIFILLFWLILRTWRTRRYITFSLLFFLFAISPVLQFLPVGQAIVAERYTYIPYIGLSLLVAWLIGEIPTASRFRKFMPGIIILLILVLFTFAYTSWNRSGVWKNSITLWTDVMKKYPMAIASYVNRGFIYNQYDRYREAIADCDAGIAIDPDHYKLYVNRGISHKRLKQYDLAVRDFTVAIEKEPHDYQSYMERGIIYTDHLNQPEEGIPDFRTYLEHNPEHPHANFNMAVAWFKLREFDSAMVYCLRAMEFNPQNPVPYYIAAVIHADRNDFENALAMGTKAKAMGYAIDEKLLKTWKAKVDGDQNGPQTP